MSLIGDNPDWKQLLADNAPAENADPARRLRWVLAGFVFCALVIFGRMIQLEASVGARFRAIAAQPVARPHEVFAARGRILARDGTVLAEDQPVLRLEMQYRWLEEPPNPTWLRDLVRSRVPRGERKNAGRMAAEEKLVQEERTALHRHLAELAGLSPAEWDAKARQIQTRVERMSRLVNSRRKSQYELSRHAQRATHEADGSWWEHVIDAIGEVFSSDDALPPTPVVLAEELQYHPLIEDLSPEAAAEIRAAEASFPGVRIVSGTRRTYPGGLLAAHLLGYLGHDSDKVIDSSPSSSKARDADTQPPRAGLMGLEKQYQRQLGGQPGNTIQYIDHRGRTLSTIVEKAPTPGSDVVLTIDVNLQRAAEALLRSALSVRDAKAGNDTTAHAGGAIVVMDVRDGSILALASAPAFDPNQFVAGDNRVSAILSDPARPLFDRAVRMAIPPGSVFKTLTAIALLESGAVDSRTPFECRGYLHQPDRWRCEIYRRDGVGHGPVTLLDALAQSCNVYFFHFANEMGPEPLGMFARQFGFGHPTGIDLPAEASGIVPSPGNIRQLERHQWRPGDTQSLAIGQSSLTVTPLQVVRLIAAVANGGQLVTPHLAQRIESPGQPAAPALNWPVTPIAGLGSETLATVRDGLRRVVDDPKGTAHDGVSMASLPIAGKTGTAQTRVNQRDHAWFAGYAPADAPRIAVVVVLEHGGDGGPAAGPVAKGLFEQLQRLGYFGPVEVATEPTIPPGKG